MLGGLISVSMVSIGGGGVSISWGVVDSVVGDNRGVVDSMMSNHWGSMDSVSNYWSSVDSMVGGSMVNSVAGSTKVGESCEGHVRPSSAQGDEGDQSKCLQIIFFVRFVQHFDL